MTTNQKGHRLTGASYNATENTFTVKVYHEPWAEMRRNTESAIASRALHRFERETGRRAVARRSDYGDAGDGVGTMSTFTFRFRPV